MQPRLQPMLVRVLRWTVGIAAVEGSVLALLAWLLPGLTVASVTDLIVLAFSMTVLQAAAWPFIYRFAARVHALLFPLLTFTLAAVVVLALPDLLLPFGVEGIRVSGFTSTLLVVPGLTLGTALAGLLFSLNDDDAYHWFVVRPLRRKFGGTPRTAQPGVLFIEIDGLAAPVLQQALAAGWLPTLARWLESGSHTLTPWETDLSSQTSASQAGILLGANDDIPAFRWYDKRAGALRVSSAATTARDLEEHLSTQTGLLRDGVSRWNMFSGDAPDALCTYSTFGERTRPGSGSYLAFFTNPYTLPRAVGLYIGDVVRERWQAWRQVRRNEQPRIRRGWSYALVRAATTTVMQEACLFMLLADMFRGKSAAYATLFAYDEVAHHSGIDRRDAFLVLARLDRLIATLARAAASAPRPYHLVVLSDHGQSMGATFRQRHGQTLAEVVNDLVDTPTHVTSADQAVEDWGFLSAAVTGAIEEDPEGPTARLLRRALRRWTTDAGITFGDAPTSQQHPSEPDAQQGTAAPLQVVVAASGNLGLVSFPQWSQRMTYETLVDVAPRLLPDLLQHPGIGFVLVRTESDGPVVFGPRGVHCLAHGRVDGDDPLAGYGARAAQHLLRTDGFSNAPDLLIMSAVDPDTQEVAAFEELVGSHGGLGGPQTQAFVLHPATLPVGDAPIVGAVALHHVLKRWLPEQRPAQGSMQ